MAPWKENYSLTENEREFVWRYIFRSNGDLSLTVWGDLIDTIDGGKRYELHNLFLQIIFGVKLTTTTSGSELVLGENGELPILSDDDFKKYIDHEDEVNTKLNPKLCCSKSSGTNVTVGAACTNENSGMKTPIPTLPGQSFLGTLYKL